MGIVKAKYDGKCKKQGCSTQIKEGEECYLDEQKQRVCMKCAPKDARRAPVGRGGSYGPKVYTAEEISVIAMRALIEKHPKLVVGDLVKISTSIGWGMKAEFQRRAVAG